MSERISGGMLVIEPDEDIWDDGWLLMEHIPATGITRWVRKDADGNYYLRTDTDTSALLAHNAEERSMMAGQRWGEGRKVASIPMNMWTNELSEAVQHHDDKYVAKWLNDLDRQKLRTFEGNV